MARGMKTVAWVSLMLTAIFITIYETNSMSIILTLAITSGVTSYHFWMRLFVGAFFKLLLNNRVDYNKKWFRVGEKEQRLYAFLRVKKWKKFFPTYDPDTFDKSKHSWREIVMAMCQAELVHESIVILSFLPIILSIWLEGAAAFVLTSVFAAVFDLIFVVIQRYNRPRVLRIIK